MGKFNLKKADKSSVKPYEKRLIDDNGDKGLEGDADRTYEKLLDEDRKPKESKGDKNYEKLLEKKRVASPSVNTEKQLDTETGYNTSEIKDDDPTPVMDMYKKTEDESDKDFKKATDGDDKETLFWDKFLHDQTPKDELTKIVPNDQGSQLLSNFDTREEFRKDNGSVGKTVPAVEILRDADSILFHLYKQAAVENRKLTEGEQELADSINKEKANILTACVSDTGS